MAIKIAKVCASFIFRESKGHTPSGLGASLFPVDRLVGENLEFLNLLAGQVSSV